VNTAGLRHSTLRFRQPPGTSGVEERTEAGECGEGANIAVPSNERDAVVEAELRDESVKEAGAAAGVWERAKSRYSCAYSGGKISIIVSFSIHTSIT
jgi:hypothetical protein